MVGTAAQRWLGGHCRVRVRGRVRVSFRVRAKVRVMVRVMVRVNVRVRVKVEVSIPPGVKLRRRFRPLHAFVPPNGYAGDHCGARRDRQRDSPSENQFEVRARVASVH